MMRRTIPMTNDNIDDDVARIRKQLPRKLCFGCGEQIGQWERRCPVCGGCPVCGKGSPKGQAQPTEHPMPGGGTMSIPFACETCGGCWHCCTCEDEEREDDEDEE